MTVTEFLSELRKRGIRCEFADGSLFVERFIDRIDIGKTIKVTIGHELFELPNGIRFHGVNVGVVNIR